MKNNLTFTNTEILGYLKNNLIKDYPEGKLMLQLNMTADATPAEAAPKAAAA